MDRMLISTTLRLVYWDGQEAHIFHRGELEDGTAHYHGLTWDDAGTLYVTGAVDFRYVVYTFDMATLQETGRIEGDLHAPHQAFWQDGRLYVTNTGKNRVDVWENGEWWSKAWHPSPFDLEHINAVWSDGKQILIGEHGQAVARGAAVRICDMDLNELKEIHIGPNIHNVYMENGIIYNISSKNDRDGNVGFFLTDPISNTHQRIEYPEWGKVLLRGLARTEDYWYVGISQWEPDRSQRCVGDAVVVQLDNDLQEVDRIVLYDYGPMHEIRLLDVADAAHNGVIGHVNV
jgi:hypothetical protein